MTTMVSISAVGATLGAALLLLIPAAKFRASVPWLLLFATIVFAFGPAVTKWARSQQPHEVHGGSRALFLAALGLVSIYGGYFGAGIGIMMLGLFGAVGMTDIHEMNSLKATLATLINGVAAVAFIVAQSVAWEGYALAVPSALGGYWATRAALRLHPKLVRGVALALAVVVTIYYFFIEPHVRDR